MSGNLFRRDWLVFAAVCAWKLALLVFTAQPIPAGDAYFYDGAVVHALNGSNYANPSLTVVLPISGQEVFSAYPPLHQAMLWVWMKAFGTSVLAAMWFQFVVFVIYGIAVIRIFRALNVPGGWINLASLFFFGITFLDRPDTLAFALGMWSLLGWVRVAGEWKQGSVLGGSLGVGVLLVLATCTSLHIGALFFLWEGLIAWAVIWGGLWEKQARLKAVGKSVVVLMVPLAAAGLVVVCLVGLVRSKYPHLWLGFKEHVKQTPTLAGWRVSHPLGLLTANLLKLLRTAPGLLAVALAAPLAVWMGRGRVRNAAAGFAPVVLRSGLVITGTLLLASLGLLMQNPVHWCAYVQPLLVGLLPVAVSFPAREGVWQRRYAGLCIGLALIAGARAIGMGTWGVRCAMDVSERRATELVGDALERVPDGKSVIASSAFLYEADRHKAVRAFHPDWIAPYRKKADLVECIAALRPARMVLTQFDYYRGCGTAMEALKARPDIAGIRVTDTAHVRPPDASSSVQRVVQHVSWAPVIVELDWR